MKLVNLKISRKSTKKEIYAFAYPNGNYSKREEDYIKSEGYSCALTCDFGYNNQETDLMKLKRISGGIGLSIHEVIVKSSGFYNFLFHKS